MSHAVAHPAYDYRTIRHFAIMSVVWGIFGMAVGVLIAAQLVWPELLASQWTHFGRLRPLHTSVIA